MPEADRMLERQGIVRGLLVRGFFVSVGGRKALKQLVEGGGSEFRELAKDSRVVAVDVLLVTWGVGPGDWEWMPRLQVPWEYYAQLLSFCAVVCIVLEGPEARWS